MFSVWLNVTHYQMLSQLLKLQEAENKRQGAEIETLKAEVKTLKDDLTSSKAVHNETLPSEINNINVKLETQSEDGVSL